MRSKIALKTLYRSPVRTVLTFILLAAVTFALFSQVIEHAVSTREMNAAVGMYYGAGSVEIEEPNQIAERASRPHYLWTDERVPMESWGTGSRDAVKGLIHTNLTPEQIDAISALPYVSGIDTRYMTAGVIEDKERLDVGDLAYDYTNTCVIEGTIVEMSDLIVPIGEVSDTYDCAILLDDCVLLAGNPGWENRMNREVDVYVCCSTPAKQMEYFAGEVIASYEYPKYVESYGPDVVSSELNVGERYTFIVRFSITDYFPRSGFALTFLTDPFLDTTPAIWNVENAPENYIDTEEFAPLKEYIALVNTDIHTFDIVYTRDMDSIRYVADENMKITTGRSITPEDDENRNMVCVVDRSLGYRIGDMITVKLGDKLFDQYRNLGAAAVVPERLSESYTEVTLEVVGMYTDVRGDALAAVDPFWSYSKNTIFVPRFLLNVPESELEGHTFAPGEVSFTVDNAWDIAAFKTEVEPMIAEMGLTLYFEDSGWLEMEAAFLKSQRLSVIKIILFSIATAVTVGFVDYLYIVGRRRDYAIMRLLGTTKRKSGLSLVLPLGAVSLCAITAGGIAATIGTTKSIAENEMLALLAQSVVSADISAGAVILGIIALTVIVLLAASVMLSIIGRQPPLILMQSKSQRRNTKVKTVMISEPENVVLGEWVSIEPAKRDGKKRSLGFVLRYIKRHIQRTAVKSVMFALVTTLLLNVAGQMYIMQGSYQKLFEETEVKSNFVGGIDLDGIFKLKDSGYVKNLYYDSVSGTEIEGDYCDIRVTTDIERCLEEPVEITYAKGYDESAMSEISGILFVGEAKLEEKGWSLGQTVTVSPLGKYSEITNKHIEMYYNLHGKPDHDNMTDEEKRQYNDSMMETIKPNIDREFLRYTDEFVIAGVVKAEPFYMNMMIFTPGTRSDNVDYGKWVVPQIFEAVVADNNKVDEYREYAEKLALSYDLRSVTFVMDASKLSNLKNNIEIMDTLLPVIVTAVFVIGAFLCGLLVVQNSLDIAIMRVLGTSKAKTRTILVLEQMILCIFGIIIAGIILYIRGALMQMLWVFGVYALVILVASIIASVAASRKNVLELLQTKE